MIPPGGVLPNNGQSISVVLHPRSAAIKPHYLRAVAQGTATKRPSAMATSSSSRRSGGARKPLAGVPDLIRERRFPMGP